MLGKWFHHLMNPHCPDCEAPCKSCETLKEQLERANYEREQLLQTILRLTGSVSEPAPVASENLKPIRPRQVPWRVRQQMLEQESQAAAMKLKEHQRSVEALEKELGVEDAS